MTDRSDMVVKALSVAALLNAGRIPSDALGLCGIDPAGVHSANNEVFGLNDEDNDVLDLGWRQGELVVIRRVFGPAWRVERTQVVTPRPPHAMNMAAHKLGKPDPKQRHR